MNKSVYRNVFKLLLVNIFVFLFCDIVVAKNTFDYISSNNIFEKCNDQSYCVPICSYTDDSGDMKALIGYHYDNKEWEVSFTRTGIKQSGEKYSQFWYAIDGHMPKDKIYDGNNSGTWDGDPLYGLLTSKYSCPALLYINDNNELCFEDTAGASTKGDCSLRKGFSNSDSLLKLRYIFSGEYEVVIKGAYDDLFFQQIDDDEEKNKQKLEFLHFVDSQGIKEYDSSKSAKENALQNCDYIKANTENGKLSSYMKRISNSNQEYINKYINPALASNSNSKKDNFRSFFPFDDISFYKYDILYSMMVEKNDSSGNSDNMKFKSVAIMQSAHANNQANAQPAFRYLYDLFGNNVSVSINYIVSMCGEEGIIIDAPSTNDALIQSKQDLGLYIFSDPVIDFDDEYKCSDFFSEEIVDIIQTGYFVIEMIGLAILIIFSAIDYMKIFLNDNSDELKKANSNLFKRLILAVILFLLPAVVNLLLRIFKIENVEGIDGKYHLCVHISNK